MRHALECSFFLYKTCTHSSICHLGKRNLCLICQGFIKLSILRISSTDKPYISGGSLWNCCGNNACCIKYIQMDFSRKLVHVLFCFLHIKMLKFDFDVFLVFSQRSTCWKFLISFHSSSKCCTFIKLDQKWTFPVRKCNDWSYWNNSWTLNWNCLLQSEFNSWYCYLILLWP